MRPLIAILASLYPRSWRERYGDEFAALLDDLDPSPRTALSVFTGALAMQMKTISYGWIFAISTLCTCGAFVATLHFSEGEYVSHGTLGVDSKETQHVIGESVYGFAQAVESREALTDIITAEHLYESERTRKSLEDLLDGMRRSIHVGPMQRVDGSLAAISVAFDYSDPRTAQGVTDRLLASFVDRSSRSATTLRVLDAAELPKESSRNLTLVAANAAAFAGLLALGLLLLLRRLTLRKA